MQGSTVVAAPLQLAGQEWSVTCVSMGNPHAVVFGTNSSALKVWHLFAAGVHAISLGYC